MAVLGGEQRPNNFGDEVIKPFNPEGVGETEIVAGEELPEITHVTGSDEPIRSIEHPAETSPNLITPEIKPVGKDKKMVEFFSDSEVLSKILVTSENVIDLQGRLAESINVNEQDMAA